MTVDFSVVLSPTYLVPVLWFSMVDPTIGTTLEIDLVYARLVPQASQPALRNIGVIGGISMAVSFIATVATA